MARAGLGIFHTRSWIVALPSPRATTFAVPPLLGAKSRAARSTWWAEPSSRTIDDARARSRSPPRRPRDRRAAPGATCGAGGVRRRPGRPRRPGLRRGSTARARAGSRVRPAAGRRRPACARCARARVRADRSLCALQVFGEAGEPAPRPGLDGAERQPEALGDLALREPVAVGQRSTERSRSGSVSSATRRRNASSEATASSSGVRPWSTGSTSGAVVRRPRRRFASSAALRATRPIHAPAAPRAASKASAWRHTAANASCAASSAACCSRSTRRQAPYTALA